MFYSQQMGIAAAIEDVYGTDQIPTAVLNAILAENVKIVALDGDELERPHVRPGGFGGFMKTIINKRVSLDFDVRLRAAGAAGSIPSIDAILRAVGFAGFNTVGVDHQYKLVSENHESATVYLFRGNSTSGIRHRLLGARGSWKFSVSPKGDPVISFSLQGLYVDPDSLAMPSNFDFSGFTNVAIPPVNKTNTTFTLGGYAAILDKLDIDSGLTVAHRPKVNHESIDITGRSVTGSIVIQEPALATKDFFSTSYGAPEVMVFENGLTPGQIFRIDAPLVQRAKPEITDVDGVSHLTIPTAFLPSDAGDDNDLIFTFK